MSLLTIALALPAVASPTPLATPVPAVRVLPGEQSFEQLEAKYDEAYSAWYKRYRGAKTREEQMKIGQENPTPAWTPRFFALAEENPETEDAFEALTWLVSNGGPQDRDRSLGILQNDFLQHEGLHEVCMKLRDPSLVAEGFLREVMAKTSHENVRAWTTYALTQQLSQQSRVADMLRDMPEAQRKGYANFFGEEMVTKLLEQDGAEVETEIEGLLTKICASYDNDDLKQLFSSAKGDLYEIQNLAIGKVAPDIEGEDLDGVSFKLSDYRGKVVVLDFWGNW